MRFSKFLSSLFKSTTSAQKVIKPATKVVQEEIKKAGRRCILIRSTIIGVE